MAPLELVHVADLGVEVVAESGEDVRVEVLPLMVLNDHLISIYRLHQGRVGEDTFKKYLRYRYKY